MTKSFFPAAILAAACYLAACGAHGTGGAVTPPQTAQGLLAGAIATPTPLLIHVGFNHPEHTDTTFGPVYFYSPTLSGHAQVIRVRHGSKVQFVNDDPSFAQHTASGLGSTAFPRSFDNTSGIRRSGITVNASLTWSTGTISHGQKSQIFTIGPVGHYFFGCRFHYTTKPTSTNRSMGDVIVSM